MDERFVVGDRRNPLYCILDNISLCLRVRKVHITISCRFHILCSSHPQQSVFVCLCRNGSQFVYWVVIADGLWMGEWDLFILGSTDRPKTWPPWECLMPYHSLRKQDKEERIKANYVIFINLGWEIKAIVCAFSDSCEITRLTRILDEFPIDADTITSWNW